VIDVTECNKCSRCAFVHT